MSPYEGEMTPPFINSFSARFAIDWSGLSPTATWGSAVWPASNLAIYVPINVPYYYSVRRMFVENGAAVSGNFDVGIYSRQGTRLYSSGSTAQSGTQVNQFVTPTEFILSPGHYYLAMVHSNTTGQYARIDWPSTNFMRIGGVLQESLGATALPAIATPVQVGQGFIPLFGMTRTPTGYTG